MNIRIRYFASLRERMGRGEECLQLAMGTTIAQVWGIVSDGARMPENLLCARNLDYVTPDVEVADGDEVAFFPPVTGG